MYIANPIYDSVFKYLLNDNKVAKIVLSTLINKEVVELSLKPTENLFRADEALVKYTVFRMDFSAKVKMEDGSYKAVIIELQKAKLPNDIIRFRRYLASVYRDPENVKKTGSDKETFKAVAIPIMAVYILGHLLEGIDVPTIRVDRNYIDAATGKEIFARNEFIEGITHDALIIQLPALKNKRRTSLERMLALFDPSAQKPDDQHLLSIKEEDVPVKYRPVFRRLLQAALTPEIQRLMDEEDEYLDSLMDYERALAIKDSALAEKDSVIAKKDSTIAEKEGVIAKKDSAIAEKDSVIASKDKILSDYERVIAELKKKLESKG
ncbi:MAG: hypothetical protein HQM08_30810 [Candidatus Riflebacteria bacterium]|nr:hypothetical protein [Candidatus Riflebacteria bacterium]